MSEIFPLKARGISSGACVLTNWAMAFLVTKEFHDFIVSTINQNSTFFFLNIKKTIKDAPDKALGQSSSAVYMGCGCIVNDLHFFCCFLTALGFLNILWDILALLCLLLPQCDICSLLCS